VKKRITVAVLVLLAFLLSWRYGWGYEARLVRESKRLTTVSEVRDFAKRHNLKWQESKSLQRIRGEYLAETQLYWRAIQFTWHYEEGGRIRFYQRKVNGRILGNDFDTKAEQIEYD
jgi:hypothetical protein